jgi:hypothetical protein
VIQSTPHDSADVGSKLSLLTGNRRHLAVADEQALITARARIEGKGIETYLFHEPDVDGYTAFPSQPIAAVLKSKRKALSVSTTALGGSSVKST